MLYAYLWTSDNHFGFKKKHATDLCVYMVKSVVNYYTYFKSPVYSCFLGASKAFEVVNHWTLFKKLVLRGVPSLLVRILCMWYRSQQIRTQWGNMKSAFFFTISNGVWQGGILSRKLFSVYMYISNMLIKSGLGCHIDNTCVNHMFYADDL